MNVSNAKDSTERAEDIDERSDRPVLDATLVRAVNIILEASRTYQNGLDEYTPMTDENFEQQALEQVKALMLAGWISPSERTVAVPNGMMLGEHQWRALAEGNDITVMLPSGRQVLTLTVSASAVHPRSHFTIGSRLHDELWRLRAELANQSSWPSDGEAATPASAPPTKSNDKSTQLHRDIITVLRYVSGGFGYGSSATYPDAAARRALGKIDLQGAPVPTPITEQRFSGRIEDCGRVKDELLDIVSRHPLTHGEFTGTNKAEVCAGYVAQQAGRLLRWYEGELTRATTEGTPGLVHQVDQAFHRLVIRERDHAWVENENRKRRIDELEVELIKMKRLPESDDRMHSALTWAKMEGIRLTNYHGWDREQRDIKTPITRTQFLELAKLCTYVVLEGLEPDDSREEK